MAGELKQKIWRVIYLLLVMLCSFALPALAQYGGGSGTAEDPFLIYTAEHMNAIGANANDWDKHFKLIADINLGKYSGTAFNLIGFALSDHNKIPFTGVFDGNSQIISNFSYKSSVMSRIGLFRYVNGANAQIKNLGLINPDISMRGGHFIGSLVGYIERGTVSGCYAEGGSVLGRYSVGGLVGYNCDTVINSKASCEVSGERWIGGLLGWNEDGQVERCSSAGTVNGWFDTGGLVGYNVGTVSQCFSTGDVTGSDYVGGLVGSNREIITDCYAAGTVTGRVRYPMGSYAGNRVIGGLVGYNLATVDYCYSTGGVTGDSYVGGLMGFNEDSVSFCFWDIETSGLNGSDGGNGMTSAEMKMPDTFIGWGGWNNQSRNIWTINEGNDYPRLWWENTQGHLIEPMSLGNMHATDPSPADGAFLRDTWATLNWIPGDFAVSHEVYFGDNFQDVNDGMWHTYRENITSTSYIVGLPGFDYPSGLIPGTTYYWRIDENQSFGGKQRGNVWSFSIARKLAYNPSPPDGSVYEDTWISLNWTPGDFAVSHDVYVGDNFEDVNIGTQSTFQGNQTNSFFVLGFPGFPYPNGLVPGSTYYWRIDEVNDNEPNSPWKGDVWSFGIPPKTAYNPDPFDCSESIELNVKLSWTPGFGAKLHTVYFGDNFDDVNDATGGEPIGFTTYYPGTLEMAKTYYWRVDELDGVDIHKGDVWSFFTQGIVGNPNPSNGAVDVKLFPILSWIHGIYADSHQVYFGYDEKAVTNADSDSPEYKGSGDFGSESYDPGKLELNTTYYWRVDEVNIVNPDSPWKGPVWSFKTANFLIVDDFESYNDLDEDQPGSNRIYLTWIDGWEDPINGSIVGETFWWGWNTIVHSGLQSMPFDYDNSVGKSEATANIDKLEIEKDWTIEGVGILSLWYRGSSSNDIETMYVVLNGFAVVDNNNPNATQVDLWTEWRIDLHEFTDQGVDLTNINSITIGLGNRSNPVAGGTGRMYFDDIRLYRKKAEQAP